MAFRFGRLATGLLISALATLALGGVVGMASASTGVPERFGTPAPMTGDAVAYNFTYGDGEGGGFGSSSSWQTSQGLLDDEPQQGERTHEVSFDNSGWGGVIGLRWAESMTVRDSDGRTWQAPSIEQVAIHHALDPERWLVHEMPASIERVAVQDGRFLALERGGQSAMFSFSFSQPGSIDLQPEPELEEGELHVDYATGSLAPCLLQHGLQTEHNTSEPVQLFGGCFDLGIELPALFFHAVALDELETGDAIRYEAPGMTVWFAADVPYPVRIDTATDAAPVRIELVDFIPGEGAPVGDATLVDGQTAPGLRFAGARTWGIDDRGIDHPFTLSQAIQQALGDPTYPDFRDWTANHPDWFAAAAKYTLQDDTGDRDHIWDVRAVDGDDVFDLTVVQQVRPVGGDALRVLGDAPEATTYSYGQQMFSARVAFIGEVHIPSAPVPLPTVASAVARWQHFSDAPFTSYGFELRCGVDCDAPTATVVVGQSILAQDRRTDDPTDPSGYFLESYRNDRSDLLWIRDGETTEHATAFARESSQPASPSVAFGGDVSTASMAGPVWKAPPPAAAAGIGIAAVFTGLLYWLWPALKGGMIAPLFSRIRNDQVLEHPVRQEVHDAIKANPGIHFQELGRQLNGAHGSLHHHVRKLEQAGIITTQTNGGYRCYFVKGIDRRVMAAAPALKSPVARKALELVCQRPNITAGELASAAGLSPSTVSHHVRRLEAAGVVQVQRIGRKAHLVPTESAVRAIQLAA